MSALNANEDSPSKFLQSKVSVAIFKLNGRSFCYLFLSFCKSWSQWLRDWGGEEPIYPVASFQEQGKISQSLLCTIPTFIVIYNSFLLPSNLIAHFFAHLNITIILRLPTLWTLVCGHCNQIWLYCSHQARGEMAVREEFPEATIVRPATCFGHEDHFLNYYACKLFCWRLSGKRLPPTPNSVICTIS